MPLINLGRGVVGGEKKQSEKEIFVETARKLVSLLYQAPPRMQAEKGAFSTLGRARCVAPPHVARSVCNYSPLLKSWASNKAAGSAFSEMETRWAEGPTQFTQPQRCPGALGQCFWSAANPPWASW